MKSKNQVIEDVFNKAGLAPSEYELVRRKGHRNLRMHFNGKGILIVSIPYLTSNSSISDFVERNIVWIKKNKSLYADNSFKTGEKLPFWGKMYDLVVQNAETKKASITLLDNLMIVYYKSNDSLLIKQVLKNYYTKKLFEYVDQRTMYWCLRLGLDKPEIKICNAQTRWGVCYRQKKLIKYSLICATLEESLIDMIVLHEVCHLVYSGHQDDFWNLFERNMPDIEERKKLLREISKNGNFRNLF